MGNREKRASRAKKKAKKLRVHKNDLAKAKNRNKTNTSQILNPSPELVSAFSTFPAPENKNECLLHIREYLSQSGQQFTDAEASEKLIYTMYRIWLNSVTDGLETVNLHEN